MNSTSDTVETSTPPPVAPPGRTFSGGELVRVALLAAFVLGAMLFLRYTPWGQSLKSHLENAGRFRQWLAQWGHWSWLVTLLVGTAAISVGFPRIAFSGLAGALCGVVWGTVLAQVATTLAAAPSFYYTRFIGREMAVRRMGNRLQRFDGLIRERGFMVFLLIRICPVGNAFVTSCLAGVSGVRFRDYIAASFLGFLPETFIFALLGGGFGAASQLKLWSSIALLALFSLGFAWYFKKSAFAAQIVNIMREGKQ